MIAVDTNILVYAHRREVREHEQSVELMRELTAGDQRVGLPWPCVYEFLSVVTNHRIWKGKQTTPAKGMKQVQAWRRAPNVSLLTEVADHLDILAPFLENPRVQGGVIHDAKIAAICVAHGVEYLLSRDRDFSLFPELRLRNPFEA